MAASKPKSPTNPSLAVELLMSDHRKVESLFKDFEDAEESPARQDIALQICKELTVHASVEEEIFYPFLRENIEQTDLLDEAEVEHQSCKDLIAQIEAADEVDDMFDAKVTVLKEYIEHHVKEEEGEMFQKLGHIRDELDALGQEMYSRKAELSEEVGLEMDPKDEKASAARGKARPAAR